MGCRESEGRSGGEGKVATHEKVNNSTNSLQVGKNFGKNGKEEIIIIFDI